MLEFLCMCASSHAQSLDSLESMVRARTEQDSIRVNLLNRLSLRVLKRQPSKSVEYATMAKALARELNFPAGEGEADNNLAIYHLMQGEADVALELGLDALRIGEQTQRAELIANSYATLGTIYHNELDFDKALLSLKKAGAINAKLDNVLIATKVLNARGGIARDKGEYDSAMFFYNQALSLMQRTKEDYRMPEILNNIGIIFIRRKMIGEGMRYYFQALAVAKDTDNRRSQALALGNIGSTLLSQKKYSEAEKYLLEGMRIAKALGIRKTLSAHYMWLGQLKNETGKFNDAHYYLSSFYELKDSLLNAEKIKKMAELEVRYETEKKEHTIALLARDNRIQQLWINLFIVLAGLLIIICFFIYYFQKFRARKNRQILDLEIDRLTTEHRELSEKFKDALTTRNMDVIDSIDQRLLKKAVDVVEYNIADPTFGVEEMARELGMSRTNMHRRIKALTGFPPSELIRSIRLKRAAALLLSKADSVSQISMLVGFEDHSYFSKSFKKHFGVAPSEYLQSKESVASANDSLSNLN